MVSPPLLSPSSSFFPDRVRLLGEVVPRPRYLSLACCCAAAVVFFVVVVDVVVAVVVAAAVVVVVEAFIAVGVGVDGPIAANHGQIFIESPLALLRIFNQIVDPLLLLV